MTGEAASGLRAAGLLREANGSIALADPQSSAFPDRLKRLSGGQSKPNASDKRTETEKDRGRLSYSGYLRRLAGVTQVVSPSLTLSHLHTRESHTQKVALVAREIGEDISRRAEDSREVLATLVAMGGLDVPACEAAGLAHDLGHPPFGHSGEVALNRVLREHGVDDGFEGNAQSFRIVSRLDIRKLDNQTSGLDLTALTLAAVLKYPYDCPEDRLITGSKAGDALRKPPKFGFYTDDHDAFSAVAKYVPAPIHKDRRKQTLEASIMDLADDITYAENDLEDIYRENAVDFATVERDIDRAREFFVTNQRVPDEMQVTNPFLLLARDLQAGPYFNKGLFEGALLETKGIIENAGFRLRYDGSQSRLTTAVGVLSSQIETFFKALRVTEQGPYEGGPSVFLEQQAWHLMQCLKAVTRQYVVSTSRLGLIEVAQQRVVRSLFKDLVNWLVSGPLMSELPHPLVDFLLTSGVTTQRMPEVLSAVHYRAISDYICSMSDQECLMRSRWLHGSEVPEFATSH